MTQREEKDGLPPVSFAEFAVPDYETWKQEAIVTLKGASFEKKLLTKTYENITLEPIYTMEMAPAPDEISNLPGMGNYMRGTKEGGYITDPWLISQEVADIMPEKLNQMLINELEKGSTAINIALDFATLHGLDAESIETTDVVNGGVSITTIEDLQAILQNVNLADYSIYLNGGASTAALVGMFSAALKGSGVNLVDVHGVIGADPIGVLAKEGQIPCALDALYDEMAHTTLWAEHHMPSVRTILIDGQTYNDGGASAVQELGYMLATGVAYIRALQLRGLTINTIARHMQFSFSLGSNFFMEIAKLRAARLLWTQIVESFGGDQSAQKMAIHARTARFNKTVYDPYVNMLRTTTEAFSGIVGGVDSLQVAPFDECIRQSDEFSRRIARNTQIMLQNECNLRQPVDPAGGSWYIESLTRQLADKAWQVLQNAESEGSIVAALRKGLVQQDIEKVLLDRFKKLAQRADRAVGVNMYANAKEVLLEKATVDAEQIKAKRQAKVALFKRNVEQARLNAQLGEVADAMSGVPGELIEVMEYAFNAGATLGEITHHLRLDEEEERIDKIIEKHRVTEQFELLRYKAKIYEKEYGKKLSIFLCNMGKIPQHKARADFSTGFFEVGGFEILKNDGFLSVEEAAKAAAESGAFAAIICSTDDTYPELVPPVAKLIKQANPSMNIMLAGAPAAEFEGLYREAGVDEFIHVRANCLHVLTWLQQQGGIK